MATLKNLVDETSNIKNELVTCHTNLKNNLIAKGVECINSDKLANLISKVDNINTTKKVVASSNNDIFFSSYYETVSTTYSVACKFYVGFEGSVLISSFAWGVNGSYRGQLVYKLLRGGAVVDQSEVFSLTSSSTAKYVYTFSDIKYGDTIEVHLASPVNSYYARVKDIRVQGNII